MHQFRIRIVAKPRNRPNEFSYDLLIGNKLSWFLFELRDDLSSARPIKYFDFLVHSPNNFFNVFSYKFNGGVDRLHPIERVGYAQIRNIIYFLVQV